MIPANIRIIRLLIFYRSRIFTRHGRKLAGFNIIRKLNTIEIHILFACECKDGANFNLYFTPCPENFVCSFSLKMRKIGAFNFLPTSSCLSLSPSTSEVGIQCLLLCFVCWENFQQQTGIIFLLSDASFIDLYTAFIWWAKNILQHQFKCYFICVVCKLQGAAIYFSSLNFRSLARSTNSSDRKLDK